MSKSLSYLYSGTKGHIVSVASSLPTNGRDLVKQGWEDISTSNQAQAGHYYYRESSTGLKVGFDKAVDGAPGFKGKDHYHIFNPDATNSSNKYLDRDGNPVRKGSKKSHIMPHGGR